MLIFSLWGLQPQAILGYITADRAQPGIILGKLLFKQKPKVALAAAVAVPLYLCASSVSTAARLDGKTGLFSYIVSERNWAIVVFCNIIIRSQMNQRKNIVKQSKCFISYVAKLT